MNDKSIRTNSAAFGLVKMLFLVSLIFLQLQMMVDAGGEFFLIVGDKDEGLVVTFGKSLNDLLYELAVGGVETMKGFVENQQLGVFHEGAGKEHQALLTAGKLQEGALLGAFNTEYPHPETAFLIVFFGGVDVQAYGVFQTAGHNLDGWDVTVVGAMHLGRDIADVFFDVPDALS